MLTFFCVLGDLMMTTSRVAALLLTFACLCLAQPTPVGDYNFELVLFNDAFNYYKVHWSLEEPNLRVGIVCKSPGWCGIGTLSILLTDTDCASMVPGRHYVGLRCLYWQCG